jgi:fructokinase
MKRKVIGIGESVLDIIIHDGQVQRAVAGGSVFNGMISLSRCGIPALFVSELGKDEAGRIIRSFMEENGLTTTYIDFFDDGHSPLSLAVLDEHRNAQYSFYKDFPDKRLQVDFPAVATDDILMFGSYFAVQPELRGRVRTWLQEAQQQGAILYYDINFRQAHADEQGALLPAFLENFAWASIVRCSDEDLHVLFPQETVEAVYDRYFAASGKTLIITQGEGPVRLKIPAGERRYPVEAVQPVSTIGAGDNFNAGLVYGMLRDGISAASLDTMSAAQWDRLIDCAQRFATEVCLSPDNYVPAGFTLT